MKKRNIGLAIIAIIIAGFFSVLAFNTKVTNKVFAKTNSTQNDQDTCESFVYRNLSQQDDPENRTTTLVNNSSEDLTVVVSKTVNGQTLPDEPEQILKANDKFVYSYGEKNSKIEIRYTVTRKTGNNRCVVQYETQAPSITGDLPNPHIDLCNRWINGEKIKVDKNRTLNSNLDSMDEAKKQEFTNRKRNFNYCQSVVSNRLPEDVLLKSMKTFETAFEASYVDPNEKVKHDSDIEELGNLSDYEEVKDTKNVNGGNALQCKSNSVYLNPNLLESKEINGLRMNNTTESTNGKPNLYLYKHTEVHDVTYTPVYNKKPQPDVPVCTVTCTEYLKVNFDPPQAVKGGACFSYSVQVISKTICDSEVKENSAPQMQKSCTPVPHCNNYALHNYAGPNEDFDMCVNKCDGGKYSDSCVDKCYKKTYEDEDKSDSKSKTTKETTKATKTKVTLNDYAENILAKKMANNVQCPGPHPSVQELRDWAQNTVTGSYYMDNGQIKYRILEPYFSSDCYWAFYAPWYLIVDTERTLSHDAMNTNGNGGPWGLYGPSASPSNRNNPSNGGYGFSVHWRDMDTSGCTNTCVWIGCEAGSIRSAEELQEEYDANVQKYNQALAECSAEAKCRTTDSKTSTFTIGTKKQDESWEAHNTTVNEKADSSSSGTCSSDGAKIILSRDSGNTKDTLVDGTGGLCYCGDSEYGKWHHYTRWTFPGSWYNYKNGKVRNTPPTSGNEDSYEGGYNLYCISDEEDEVNVDWWKEYNKNITDDKVGRENLKDMQPDDYNIWAKSTNFGNYGWNLNMECFYGVYNHSGDEPECDSNDPNCEATTSDDDDEITSSNNVRIKAASTADLLPDKDADGEQEEAFNWSDEASKLDIEGYEIAPEAYKKAVEEREDTIFENEDQLDYQFVLTGNDMKAIVDSDDGKYGNYERFSNGSEIFAKNTNYILRAYESGLFRGGPITYKKAPSKGGLKCNNIAPGGSSCETFASYYSPEVAALKSRIDAVAAAKKKENK